MSAGTLRHREGETASTAAAGVRCQPPDSTPSPPSAQAGGHLKRREGTPVGRLAGSSGNLQHCQSLHREKHKHAMDQCHRKRTANEPEHASVHFHCQQAASSLQAVRLSPAGVTCDRAAVPPPRAPRRRSDSGMPARSQHPVQHPCSLPCYCRGTGGTCGFYEA